MYTLHFGHGMEHTQVLYDLAKGNYPYVFDGWDNGNGDVPDAVCENTRIVSHKEIFDRYGVKGGCGEYCLETWSHDTDRPQYACRLYTGGHGDTSLYGKDVRAFYLKFDFLYTETDEGTVVILQRSRTGLGDPTSEDLTLTLKNGYLEVLGSKHITQPDTEPPTYREDGWIPRGDGRNGSIYLAPNKWHEIQVFVNANQGWDVSEIGANANGLGYFDVDPFVPYFQAYEQNPVTPSNPVPKIKGSEDTAFTRPLRVDTWPSNGHPKFPNAILPGQDQTSWPPENYGSGQYFYGDKIGMIYVWVNGQLDLQHTTNMSNEQTGWESIYSQQSVFLGHNIATSDPDDPHSGRFFYDNVIWNDVRNPSGTYPSKIFTPPFSSDDSLEWEPNYKLKFTAMQMDPNYWEVDGVGRYNTRKHNTWMPNYPLGALVPSGQPYWVDVPARYGSPTDSMIPHGSKLTVIHTDWNGNKQEYNVRSGNRTLYPDYNVDYAYQNVQPNESNPFAVNQDDPRLDSLTSGNKVLFYLKRPAIASGQQPVAGGYGLGGMKDYMPNIYGDLGQSSLPPIYRIWTCIQDHVIGTSEPVDLQYHLIRVPSGISGYVDYLSDNQCPGDRAYRSYTNGNAALADGYSMCDWPYNPITGDPWVWDDLDTIQIGAYHGTHLGGNRVILYTIYLVVEHAGNIDPESDIVGTNILDWSIADDIPFISQDKKLYMPGWAPYNPNERSSYYNIWNIDPPFVIERSDRETEDGQAIVSNPQYSGIIEWDYKIRYLTGEIIQGSNYRKFDEHFDPVFVYTVSGINPSNPIRHPMRGEVITDVDGNHFTFLTYPVLEWNDKKYPTDPGLSPLDYYPYVRYDYDVMYIAPLQLGNFSEYGDFTGYIDTNLRPNISGGQWTINKRENAFNFRIDSDSYFHPFSPSSVVNHAATNPDESLDYTFPQSRSGHDYYFQSPDLPSGSVSQVIYLTDRFGISANAIDNGLYQADIGLYQTTASQTINDSGEGRFDFYSGVPGIDTFISGYTFGSDDTPIWHLNETTVTVPSGTRQVEFTFSAIRNTPGNKSPGGTLGGTSNFASFDAPFFILQMSPSYTQSTYHPADIDEDNRIENYELSNYILQWQSGILPLGVAKKYLTRAENIWQSGVSRSSGDLVGGEYYDAKDGPPPENWVGSGSV